VPFSSRKETDKVVLSFVLLLGLVIAIIPMGMQTVWAGTFPGANGKIAFTSQRDGNDEIYVMNADSTAQTRLTNNTANDFNPSWSPDGAKIAFTSDKDFLFEIYVMNPDGTGQTRLTNNTADDFASSWSPDGAKIAFVTNRDGNFEIYVMNADGSGQTDLSNNAADDRFRASWSPDGAKIAFVTNRDGNFEEIYVMNADGTAQTRLTNNTASDFGPDWGPLAIELCPPNTHRDPASGACVPNPTTNPPIGGEILGIDVTTLFVAGAFANASWIIPIAGATAAAIVGLVLRKRIS